MTYNWEGDHDVDEQPLMLHIYECTTLTMCFTFQLEVPWSRPKSPTNTFTEALLEPNVTPLHWRTCSQDSKLPMITVPYPITDEAAKCLCMLLLLNWQVSSEF